MRYMGAYGAYTYMGLIRPFITVNEKKSKHQNGHWSSSTHWGELAEKFWDPNSGGYGRGRPLNVRYSVKMGKSDFKIAI